MLSNTSPGFDLEFAQLQDRNNRSLCEYLAADIAQAGNRTSSVTCKLYLLVGGERGGGVQIKLRVCQDEDGPVKK